MERLIHKAYKFRIYPNREQGELMHQSFGCCRFVYNYFLATHRRLNEEPWLTVNQLVDNGTLPENNWKGAFYNKFEASRGLPELKKHYPWLKNVDSNALIDATANLGVAYDRYYKKKGGKPEFKNRNSRKSYTSRVPGIYAKAEKLPDSDKWLWEKHVVDVDKGAIKIAKLGWVKAKIHRKLECTRILGMTISQDPDGAYYCSLKAEEMLTPPSEPKPKSEVGVSLGLNFLATTSDGLKFEAEKAYFEAFQQRLTKEQRKLERMEVGSKNWLEQKRRIAKVHGKARRHRDYILQCISRELVDTYEVILIQNLNIQNLMKNGESSKAFSENALGRLKELIRYKMDWSEGVFYESASMLPARRTCSECGFVQEESVQIQQEWTCPACHTKHDRDINAAVNVLNSGLLEYNKFLIEEAEKQARKEAKKKAK